MATRLRIRRARLTRQMQSGLSAGLGRAARHYQRKCVEVIGEPGDGLRVVSRAGEPPRTVTGRGQQNVVTEMDPNGRWARVGVTADGMHLFWLEVGTRYVAARPWMLPTLIRERKTMARLTTTGHER